MPMTPSKIIFSDIDGTLLDKNRALSQQTLTAYQKIRETHALVLISSRMPKGMVYFQEELAIQHYPLVSYNGGLILKNTKGDYLEPANILFDQSISHETVKDISNYLKNKDLNLSVYSYDNWYTTKQDQWTAREENNTRTQAQHVNDFYFQEHKIPAHKIMLMGDKFEIDQAYTFIENNFQTLDLYRSKDTYIEIASKKTSKGIAVQKIMTEVFPAINIKNTLAFGDNYNDIPLFNAVGTSIAVANGKPELKEIANFVCAGNKEHGVAAFLNTSLHLI